MPKGLLAMGAYLDRLNAQFDEIRDGIDAVVNRAAEDNRDVTETEQGQVDRDRTRLTELQTAIGHYTELENQSGKVAELRRTLPAPVQTRTAKESEPEYEAAREFPTAGDYAYTVHRALALKDPEAVAKLERATAHQLTSDNPGIIPRPVLGPVLNFLNATRPFINAISNRPLPGPSFDRPTITQHVAVGKQAAEKTLTDSQKMVVGKIPVNAATYAGHLNISRQDIKWSSPAILNIVFDDFAAMYALATCDDAVTQFAASIAGNAPVAIPSADAASIRHSLARPPLHSRPTGCRRTRCLPHRTCGPPWVGPSTPTAVTRCSRPCRWGRPRATRSGSSWWWTNISRPRPWLWGRPGWWSGMRTWTDSCRLANRTCWASWLVTPAMARS
jgi:hypothetical protein